MVASPSPVQSMAIYNSQTVQRLRQGIPHPGDNCLGFGIYHLGGIPWGCGIHRTPGDKVGD